MGSGEESTSTKSPRPASSVVETSMTPTTPAYPDWSSSVQALYGAGATPSFFASPVASPATHPYLWGGQHALMAPYGTPVPYPAMYPPGGVYAHPNMTLTPGAVHVTSESETKAAEGNERASKNSKLVFGNYVRKTGDSGNAASGSGNDVGTQSAESGSEGSSDGSENDNNQEYSVAKKGSFDQMLADGANAQSNGVPTSFPAAVIPIPVTNLNIGMNLWSTPAAGSGDMKLHPNPLTVPPAVAPSGMMNGQWVQDEREMKRQKRKQSNRESARRSRLRKQAECEDLQQKVEALSNENLSLRDELQRLSEECEKLEAENNTIKEELARFCGPEMLSKLDSPHSPENEGNS